MNEITCDIRELKADLFLNEYWQKKPLVIRQGFPNFQSRLSPEELAGLACEEEINSRIVIEKDGEHPWQPIYGPMDDEVFANLPETHWTLLVNDVEKHVPELVWILDQFRFIPEWRVDDLMISYAPVGGSVGPHMDLYDVFILQAEGHRRWQLSSQPVAEGNQVADTPLRIQKDFHAEHEWLLEPGDLIYIPPGVSHYGVATDDCMSYSIGFRAASHAELLNDFIAFITDDLPAVNCYRDPDLTPQTHPNEITEAAIARMRDIFRHYLDPNHPALPRWLGRFMSDPKVDLVYQNDNQTDTFEQLPQTLMRHPASQFAFIRNKEPYCSLFVDGQDYDVNEALAETICKRRQFSCDSLSSVISNQDKLIILRLYNQGKLLAVNET